VKQGQERAQLFFGGYTGVSFTAGIYILPRLPFPLISLALHFLFSLFNKEVGSYLGWVLEGDVSVGSIVVKTESEGMTSDGIRVGLKVTLIFEIENAATFLSQTKGDTNRTEISEAISSLSSARIKQQVIAKHTAVQLNQADYVSDYEMVNVWITDACAFVKEFGLSLSQSPIIQVDILSEQVRDVFDANSAAALFAKNAVAVGKSFAEFQKEVPGLSEEMAMVLFSQARAAKDGVPRTNIDVFRIK
jgi:hypothetical protein